MRARFRLVSMCVVLCLGGQWLPATVDFVQNGAAQPLVVARAAGKVVGTKPENAASTAPAQTGTPPTGAAQTGAAAAGSTPAGSVPAGAAPTGTAATGNAPTAAAPVGAAPVLQTVHVLKTVTLSVDPATNAASGIIQLTNPTNTSFKLSIFASDFESCSTGKGLNAKVVFSIPPHG